MVYLFPGLMAYHTFYIRSGGQILTADTLPTCTLIRNGVDTAEPVTVAQQQDGSYLASMLIPADWVSGDIVTMRVEAVVQGVPVPVDTLTVGTVVTTAEIEDGSIGWSLPNLKDQLLVNASKLLSRIDGDAATLAEQYLFEALSKLSEDAPRMDSGSITLEAGVADYDAPIGFLKLVRSDWGSTSEPYWSPNHPGVLPTVSSRWNGQKYQIHFHPAPSQSQITLLGSSYGFEYGGIHTLSNAGSTLSDQQAHLLLLRALIEILTDLVANGAVEPVQLHRGMGSTAANSTPPAVLDRLRGLYEAELRGY